MYQIKVTRILISCPLSVAIVFSLVLMSTSIVVAATDTTSIITVTKKENIRVVYDVSHNTMDAGIGKALYYARGLLEAYKDMGISEKELHISVVVHGAAAYWLLNSDAYQLHVGDIFAFNPNEHVVEGLLSHGVSVEICHVTMKSKGWSADDILPGVKIVHDGYTRIIDLQQQGYSYIAF